MDKADAGVWIDRLRDESVRLVLTDPPYYGISKEPWDNQWPSEAAFVSWLTDLFVRLLAKLTPDGSLVFFGGIGRHGSHPLFKIIRSSFQSRHNRGYPVLQGGEETAHAVKMLAFVFGSCYLQDRDRDSARCQDPNACDA